MAKKEKHIYGAALESEPKRFIQNVEPRNTPPRVIRNYEERGAFTASQKDDLAERFELKPELVDELSRYVGNSLDVESLVSILPVSRGKAVERGRKRLEEAARLARRLRFDQAAIQDQLEPVEADFDESGRAAPLLLSLKQDVAAVEPLLGALEAHITEIMAIKHSAAEMSPDDRRKAKDMWRVHVVRSCCYIWEDAGRKVTYTTVSHEPGKLQRRGELVELINAVVLLVTDPPTELSIETIRNDIDEFKEMNRAGFAGGSNS